MSTQTGAFQYSYPIVVPPGRNGLAPQLALSYSSQAANYGSSIGAGWTLSGLDWIESDTSDGRLASEYFANPKSYAYTSTLAGGRRLVPIAEAAPVGTTATYRVQDGDATFTRYRRMDDGRWQALTQDGLTYTFGEPANITGSIWWRRVPLTSVRDGFGNSMEFYWFSEPTLAPRKADLQISRIEYTKHATVGPAAKIEFGYEYPAACPGTNVPVGASLDVRGGELLVRGASRLSTITTKVRDTPGGHYRQVRRIQLDHYDDVASGVANTESCTADHAPIRLLAAITEKAWTPPMVFANSAAPPPETVELEPVTFTYGPLARTSTDLKPFSLVVPNGVGTNTLGSGKRKNGGTWPTIDAMLVDMDGDGRPDHVTASKNTNAKCEIRWFKNTGSSFAQSPTAVIEMPTLPWGDELEEAIGHCSLAGQYTLVKNIQHDPGNACQNGPRAGSYLGYRFVDLNGDQRPEIVTSLQHDAHWVDPDDPAITNVLGGTFACTDNAMCPVVDLACMQQAYGAGHCSDDVCSFDETLLNTCLANAPTSACGTMFMNPRQGYSCNYYCQEEFQFDPNYGNCGQPRTLHRVCEQYPWQIHWNEGGGTFTQAASQVLAPVPMDSNTGDSSVGPGRFSSESHAIEDIDGDRIPDIITTAKVLEWNNGANIPPNWWFVFRGNGKGGFFPAANGKPYVWNVPAGVRPSWSEAYSPTLAPGDPEMTYPINAGMLTDMNGDGLPDLVTKPRMPGSSSANPFEQPGEVVVYYNDGKRFRTGPLATPTDAAHALDTELRVVGASRVDILSKTLTWIQEAYRRSQTRVVDIDGDGRTDIVSVWHNCLLGADCAVTLFPGSGDGPAKGRPLVDANVRRAIARLVYASGSEADGAWEVQEDFFDINGDGEPESIQYDGVNPAIVYGQDLAGKPLRLLNRIDNGRGGAINVLYAVHNDSSVVAAVSSPRQMPSHQWVVQSLERSDAFGSPSVTTSYRYGSPVWSEDPVNGTYGFRGFERVQYLLSGGALTEESYDYLVDWSGRLAKTVVFHDQAGNYAHTISQSTWVAHTLYASAVTAYRESTHLEYTCRANQTEVQCREVAPLVVRTDTTWSLLQGGAAPLTELFVPTAVTRSSYADGQLHDGDREVISVYTLNAGADLYRVRITEESKRVVSGSTNVDVGRTQHEYVNNGLWEQKTRSWHNAATVATSERELDERGNLIWERSPRQFAVAGNAGMKTLYSYDQNKVLIADTTQQISAGNSLFVKSVIDPGTGVTHQTLGPNLAVVTVSLPLGGSYTYNSYEETRTDFDGFGRSYVEYGCVDQGSSAPYLKLATKFTSYDDDAFVVGERTSVTETAYVLFNTPATAKITERYFDGFSRLVEQKELVATGVYATTKYHYDSAGRLAQFESPSPIDNTIWEAYDYSYDSVGRITQVLRPAATEGAGRTGRSYAYNGLTTVKTDVVWDDGPAAVSMLTNDVFGRLVQVYERKGVSPSVEYTVLPTKYTYDANDNLATIVDADGATTSLVHDWLGHRTSITRGAGRTWEYTYDLDGNISTRTAPHGAGSALPYITSYTYDALNRMLTTVVGAGDLSATDASRLGVGSYGWMQNYWDAGQNGKGRLFYAGTRLSSSALTTYVLFQYDGRGNVTTKDHYFNVIGLGLGSMYTTTSRAIRRTYGAMNQVIETKYGDSLNGSVETRATMSYDRRGLPDTTTWYENQTARVVADDARNRAGMVVSRTHNLGGTTGISTANWSYDRVGRVLDENLTQAGQIKAQQVLSYYDSDDLAAMTSTRIVLLTAQSNFYEYSYDHQHQLVSATAGVGGDGFVQTMSYLDSGRIASAQVSEPRPQYFAQETVTPRNVLYQYDQSTGAESHQLTGLLDMNGGGQKATYSYDAAGNLVQAITHFGGVTETKNYGYDASGRLGVAEKGGQREYYLYSGEGERFLAVRQNSEVRMYAGPLELKFNGSNSIIRRWVYISHGTSTTRIENGSSRETTLQSTLGHGLVSIEMNGYAMASFAYAPFGEKVLQTGDATTHPRKINGKEEDSLTGLTYYGYRYYDPLAMIWTQADPLYRFAPDVSLEEPRRQNLYTYSGNNPLRYVDPDGRDIFDSAQLSFKVVQSLSSMSSPTVDKVATTAASYVPVVRTVKAIASIGELGGEVVAAAVTGDFDPLLGMGAHAETRSLDQMIADGNADVMSGPAPGVPGRGAPGGADAAGGGGNSPKSRSKPPDPAPAAGGAPHTIVERPGPDGQYTTHHGDGTYKQYRGSGQDHGGIPRPNVKETKLNTAPDGKQYPSKPEVRPARLDEIPGGGTAQ